MKTLKQHLQEKVPVLSAFMEDTVKKQIMEAVREAHKENSKTLTQVIKEGWPSDTKVIVLEEFKYE